MIRKCEPERHLYYKIMCLPLLPADLICATFNEYATEGHAFNNEAFSSFLDYVKRQWMEAVCILYICRRIDGIDFI